MCATARIPGLGTSFSITVGPQAVPVPLRLGGRTVHPNVGLVWHRFIPAHDGPSHQSRSLCGVDFSQEWQQASRIVLDDPRKQAAKRRKETKRVEEDAKDWESRGVLSWFVHFAEEALRENDLLARAAAVRREALTALGLTPIPIFSPWRLAVGLGNASAFENSGVALHALFGFPILPAASLKGIARHYLLEEVSAAWAAGATGGNPAAVLEEVLARPDALLPQAPQDLANFLFGDQDSEGMIAFHDGWPTKMDGHWFDVDVLTPHHGKYNTADDSTVAASDTDKPVPVHFLTLRPEITFEVHLGLTSLAGERAAPVAQGALRFTKALLLEVLRVWGLGSKTGSGYGRLLPGVAPGAGQGKPRGEPDVTPTPTDPRKLAHNRKRMLKRLK